VRPANQPLHLTVAAGWDALSGAKAVATVTRRPSLRSGRATRPPGSVDIEERATDTSFRA
jgi:hypothetical protein